MPKYWILGKVLPSVPEDFEHHKDYHRIDDFTRQEAKKLNLVGVKMCIDHHDILVSGEVIAQFDDPDGGKYIVGDIHTDKPMGKILKSLIENPQTKMNEISLKHNARAYYYKNDEKTIHVEKTPLEVSVVPNARRECGTCKIIKIYSEESLLKAIG